MCVIRAREPAPENCVNFQSGAKTNRGEANAPAPSLPPSRPNPAITHGLLSPSINSPNLLSDRLPLLTYQGKKPSPWLGIYFSLQRTWVTLF